MALRVTSGGGCGATGGSDSRSGACSPRVARRSWDGTPLRRDVKGKISSLMYAAAVPLAFAHRAIAGAIFVIVALMWLVPDRRIERALKR